MMIQPYYSVLLFSVCDSNCPLTTLYTGQIFIANDGYDDSTLTSGI